MQPTPVASPEVPAVIHKGGWPKGVRPNLEDYERDTAAFSWLAARRQLEGLPGGALNIAHEAVDRHVAKRGDHVALRCLRPSGTTDDLTYSDLSKATSRFANVLDLLGVDRGERVFSLLGRQPELYITALGTLKHGSVFCPLFSAFGPEPVIQRLRLGNAKVLVTTASMYARKVAPQRHLLPELAEVLLVDDAGGRDRPGPLGLDSLVAQVSDEFATAPTAPGEMALLHFTSGTTGAPKGAVHVHEAVVAHHVTGGYALDLHPDDIFWCTADPGWVTGTSYGIIAPLTHGVTAIVDQGEFDARRWYTILEEQKVTVWYTAPTAIRMLMRAGPDAVEGHDLSRLRFIASVGEPLGADAVRWGQEVLGRPIHDNWWQTETGGIMIANYAAMDIRPGSMGRPVPGIDAAILRRDDDGIVLDHEGQAVHASPGEKGDLALRPGWPSMFRGYLHDEDRYRRCFAASWYLSGDLASQDDDGYFWFAGRADDVIKSAGHLIGPTEVENVLTAHPAVVEAGVIGVPDVVAGERVKAFVVLGRDSEPTKKLRRELIGFARVRLGAAVAPKEIDFRESLPHTRSGKIVRRLLKAQELGRPEGDTSTLEQL